MNVLLLVDGIERSSSSTGKLDPVAGGVAWLCLDLWLVAAGTAKPPPSSTSSPVLTLPAGGTLCCRRLCKSSLQTLVGRAGLDQAASRPVRSSRSSAAGADCVRRWKQVGEKFHLPMAHLQAQNNPQLQARNISMVEPEQHKASQSEGVKARGERGLVQRPPPKKNHRRLRPLGTRCAPGGPQPWVKLGWGNCNLG